MWTHIYEAPVFKKRYIFSIKLKKNYLYKMILFLITPMQDVMSKAKESTFKTATCKGRFLFPFHRRLTVGPGGRPAKQAAAWRSLLGLSEQRCRKRRKRRVGCRPQGSNQAALRGLEEMTEQT